MLAGATLPLPSAFSAWRPGLNLTMTLRSGSRLAGLCGAILIAAIAADSLVPVPWQVRTGLHWLTEHFLAYLAVTAIFCLASQRPVILAGVIMALAALMEGLQGFTADRIPDLSTALAGAAGALAGALLTTLLTKLFKRREAAHEPDAAVSAMVARWTEAAQR
jgi:VanZ family protein